MRCGTFVELGALDGISHSNTLLFEERGWRGLCIEAQPWQYRQLTKNRPRCVNENVAVSEEPGSVSFTITSEARFDGLSTHIDLDKLRRHGVTVKKVVQVEAVPMRELLAQNLRKHVDLLSLDVEGAEYNVLRSVDFAATTFGVLLVEHADFPDPKILELLEGVGYQLHGMVGFDFVFANKCLFPTRPSVAQWLRALPRWAEAAMKVKPQG